jgi:hypothetical protein
MRAVFALASGLALAIAIAACTDVYPFYCELDEQCFDGDEEGVCTDWEQCAFDDDTCPAPQLRYHESAGDLADVCVGDEEDYF